MTTICLNLPSASTQSHNRACTSLAFSNKGRILSGIIANFQSPASATAVAISDAGKDITGIVVNDDEPRVGGDAGVERMGIVAEVARRCGGASSIADVK